jgi:hypothetical protein
LHSAAPTITTTDNSESELDTDAEAIARAKKNPTFQNWEKEAHGHVLKYGGRPFIKGRVVKGVTDEDKLIVRIIENICMEPESVFTGEARAKQYEKTVDSISAFSR